jgi:hypothetical protein
MEKKHESSRPKASWGKRLGIIAGILVLLVVVAYFVGTSSAFIKAVILPKAGASLNAKITVEDTRHRRGSPAALFPHGYY